MVGGAHAVGAFGFLTGGVDADRGAVDDGAGVDGDVAGGAGIGAVGGLVVGLFAPTISILGREIDRYGNPERFYWLVLAVTVLCTLAYRNLLRAPLGRAMAAVRDSEVSATAMGVHIARTKAASFGISCAITGLAGALMGFYAGAFNNETFSIVISIQLLMMIVIGGLGSIEGAALGAVMVGISRAASVHLMPELELFIIYFVMAVVLIFRPEGIFVRTQTRKI